MGQLADSSLTGMYCGWLAKEVTGQMSLIIQQVHGSGHKGHKVTKSSKGGSCVKYLSRFYSYHIC